MGASLTPECRARRRMSFVAAAVIGICLLLATWGTRGGLGERGRRDDVAYEELGQLLR
jgi:hypothetical protein